MLFDLPLQDLGSGGATLVALALLWWRMGRVESDVLDLTRRHNEHVEGHEK